MLCQNKSFNRFAYIYTGYMKPKTSLFLSSLSLLSLVVPSFLLAEVIVRERPPVEIKEVVPARPGPNHVWVGGHWGWGTQGKWEWTSGYWAVPPRQSAVWTPGHWVEGPRGGWHWIEGHWR